MKRLLMAAAAAAMFAAPFGTPFSTPAFAADVGVSINIGEPGFFGRLDIGGFPQPQVVYEQPMIIERGPVQGPPIYLRVPPGYASHWRQHCHEYNACGERVYFVKNDWYSREYAPRYQERHREHHDDHRDDHRDDHHDDHRDDRHGDDHDRGR